MSDDDGILLTDLYELTMLQAYHDNGMEGTAVFEFFVRALPPARHFLVTAGLEQVCDYLEALAFSDSTLARLRKLGRFKPGFLDALAALRFTGAVDAVPEGSVVFAGEPLLQLRAPLPQAQLVESRLVNLLHFQTMVASKAVRTVLAAHGKRCVDFGMRRAHGAEAALLSARASYLAGFDSTSNVEAGLRFGIPLSGTMAHSFIQAHDSEEQAFEHYARAFPGQATLLVDTYDVEAAARLVAALAPRLRAQGQPVPAVRIDSGDLGACARSVRAILDAAGCGEVGIFASGNLDECAVAALEEAQAPIQGYGVGTRMNTSADYPFLDCAYKLVEYAGKPRCKLSAGKATWPGVKQVFRRVDARGEMAGDSVGLAGERCAGQALLEPVMRDGRRCRPLPSLEQARTRLREQLQLLPDALRTLGPARPYAVAISPALAALRQQAEARWRPAPHP